VVLIAHAAKCGKNGLILWLINNNCVMTEQELIQGCLYNDMLAQRELYNRYSPKMLALCYRYAQNREDAEDMLQEAFVKVFSKMHTFQNKGAFEGWIRRIMVHTCINVLKRNKKFADHADISEAFDLQLHEESIASILQAKQVVACIRLLPVGFRTVLNLYAVEGYNHKEIAELLDIGESTSRSQYARAKSALLNLLIQKKIIQYPQQDATWQVALLPVVHKQ
jgi:RNA polymerase sigma factor (sigma-70 family)